MSGSRLPVCPGSNSGTNQFPTPKAGEEATKRDKVLSSTLSEESSLIPTPAFVPAAAVDAAIMKRGTRFEMQ